MKNLTKGKYRLLKWGKVIEQYHKKEWENTSQAINQAKIGKNGLAWKERSKPEVNRIEEILKIPI